MNRERLRIWQDRLKKSEAAYQPELDRMDERERVYRGSRELLARVPGDRKNRAAHVRNMTAELIEAQVDSNIPKPKVTAKRKEDEDKARLIEDMLRNELDRLPLEQINDILARTVPIQGGGFFLAEWDNRKRTHTTVGDVTVTVLHPKQVIPQAGVYAGMEAMDYFFLKLPQTRESIQRRYGAKLSDAREEEPEVRSFGTEEAAEDMVTQYTVYYRNDRGGIGRYSWVNDTELEDLEDFQVRRDKDGPKEFETLLGPVYRSDGTVVEGTEPTMGDGLWDVFGGDGAGSGLVPPGVKIPCYKPSLFPVILQKNVSVFGQLLGDSDVDKIRDQQNTANRIESKIVEKLIKSGSYLTLPDTASIRADAEDMKVIRLGSAADAQLISVKDMEGNISQDMAYLAQVYEEARQIIGVTDSFQGRKDTTATSGKAKEFSAAQAAGRLESKRVMKDAAYALLFEIIFKLKLAYADEARPVTSRDMDGNTVYEEFNRWDFLEQDAAGEWYWNDQFLFSCDTTAPLANNREAMWQETRQNLQSGAFGDPTDLSTLILFWTKMELLHYPGAGETKSYLERRLQQRQMEQQQAQQMAAAQAQEMALAQATAGGSDHTMTGGRTNGDLYL